MSANLTGLPANRVYVYPGSYEDTSTEAIAVAAGYVGSRGSGGMQPSPNAFTLQYTGTAASSVTLSIANKHLTITAPGDANAQVNWDLTSSGADIVPSGLDTLGGVIFTLTQRGVFSVFADPNMKSAVKSEDLADVSSQDFQNLTDTQFANKVRALVFKSAVWGVPFGMFWHMNELSSHQVGILLNTLKASGATLMTNTQLAGYLLGTQQDFGTTYYADFANGSGVDLRPTAASPVVNAGTALTSEFKFDLMGVDETLFGANWEMGAMGFVPETTGRAK